MLKSNPSYLGIAGKNPALGPPKSALGLRPWADFGGPRAGFFPEFLGQGLDFLPKLFRKYGIHATSRTTSALGGFLPVDSGLNPPADSKSTGKLKMPVDSCRWILD